MTRFHGNLSLSKTEQFAGRLPMLLRACRLEAAQLQSALADRIQAGGRALDVRGMTALFTPLHAPEPTST